MIKKIFSILAILISPVVSYFALGPFSVWPAIFISHELTRKQCSNITGDNLCGLGTAIVVGFIISEIVGFILVGNLHPSFFQNLKMNGRVLPTVGLLLYFIIVTLAVILFAMVERGAI